MRMLCRYRVLWPEVCSKVWWYPTATLAVLLVSGKCCHHWACALSLAVCCTAAVAHKQVQAKGNFMMVGAYPQGAPAWDCFKGDGGEQEWQEAMASIKHTRVPETDPVFGPDPQAPMFEHWQHAGS